MRRGRCSGTRRGAQRTTGNAPSRRRCPEAARRAAPAVRRAALAARRRWRRGGLGTGTAGTSTAGSGAASGPARPSTPPRPAEPETVSRDWSSGRSSVGGGYDPSMRTADGTGAAGPPPGNPSGSVMNFGRYAGWSLGEISRSNLEYLEWLDRMPIGRPYRDEIDAILRQSGRRRSAEADKRDRRGLFRRR